MHEQYPLIGFKTLLLVFFLVLIRAYCGASLLQGIAQMDLCQHFQEL